MNLLHLSQRRYTRVIGYGNIHRTFHTTFIKFNACTKELLKMTLFGYRMKTCKRLCANNKAIIQAPCLRYFDEKKSVPILVSNSKYGIISVFLSKV